jgi:23S rRNA pseudouridine2605 synthase
VTSPARRDRVQKILAAAGVASRRAAEDLIRAGRVEVNGEVVALGATADPSRDTVSLDGESVRAARPVYWVLNKPAGVLSTTSDPHRRQTVLDLLPGRGERLFPIGRLDRDTRGLLLITNDGPWADALLHPSHRVEREYRVEVRGAVEPHTVKRLERGIVLEGKRTAPAKVSGLKVRTDRASTGFRLTLIEGRKRQIRNVCYVLGHRVLTLTRIRMGPLHLGDLGEGEVRTLSDPEHQALSKLVERHRSRGGKQNASKSPDQRRRRTSRSRSK